MVAIVYRDQFAGLQTELLQLLFLKRTVKHSGPCAAVGYRHPHRFRRVSDDNHVYYVSEFFVVAIFLEDSSSH
ncbi:hypothetical protein [Bradyrhizobium sp. USDA 4452]